MKYDGFTMTITTTPPRAGQRGNYRKFGPVYERLNTLPQEKWLVVRFKTLREATSLRASLNARIQKRQIEAKLRGMDVYVRNLGAA